MEKGNIYFKDIFLIIEWEWVLMGVSTQYCVLNAEIVRTEQTKYRYTVDRLCTVYLQYST